MDKSRYVDDINNDGSDSKIKNKLQLIENVLRYQVLGNVDTISNSIVEECEKIKVLLLLINQSKENLNDLNEFCDNENSGIKVRKIDRIYADIMECIFNITSSARSSETMIKNPIRIQFKSISGIRRFEIKGE